MKLGIIGLDQSGKTTVFNALTGSNKEVGTFGKIEAHLSVVKVPDERIDWLSQLYDPKKTVYASIEFVDIPGSINDSSSPEIIAAAREVDALVFVIRAFKNPGVAHSLGNIDPLRDFERIKTGLIVADMIIAEKRIDRLKKSITKGTSTNEEKLEQGALEKIMECLENDKGASFANLTHAEEKATRSFQFLTLKPFFTLLNISDNELNSSETKTFSGSLPECMVMCANIEMEINELDPKDRQAFLDDLGIEELSLNPFILKAYKTLGLISFFTVGKDEVRAWTCPAGLPAVNAAGKIHSDLERGFIRAEVFSYDDLNKAGSEREVKNAGLFRLEGKTYIVQDGDILSIKFSV
ncbi:MAG: redox-regulated ATPase YchF [Candidatus Omnitrophica bacterium]|nr:redox-regulated ATPase YchF [Candidatus Omnitrophota bacterium]